LLDAGIAGRLTGAILLVNQINRGLGLLPEVGVEGEELFGGGPLASAPAAAHLVGEFYPQAHGGGGGLTSGGVGSGEIRARSCAANRRRAAGGR
jgi:hypothetical protein